MYLKTLHGCERATYFSLTREIRFAALQGPNRWRRGLIQLLVYAIYLVYQSSSNPQDQNGLPIHTHVTIIKN
jgi:hypothetical protein